MIQFLTACAECGASPGELHAPGCSCEECPRCGLSMVYCRCQDSLPPGEEFGFAVALAAKFENRLHSDSNLARGRDKDRPSLVESAAALRGVIERPGTIVSDAVPIGWGEPGQPVFSDEVLKEALNLPWEGVDYIRLRMFEQQASPSYFLC